MLIIQCGYIAKENKPMGAIMRKLIFAHYVEEIPNLSVMGWQKVGNEEFLLAKDKKNGQTVAFKYDPEFSEYHLIQAAKTYAENERKQKCK